MLGLYIAIVKLFAWGALSTRYIPNRLCYTGDVGQGRWAAPNIAV